jgi:hypothetical protein
LKALTEELQSSSDLAAKTHKGRLLIKYLQQAIDVILNPLMLGEQKVDMTHDNVLPENVTVAPQTITKITNVLTIMQTRDPTAKQNLIKTTHIHHC